MGTPSGMYSQNQLQFILAEIGAERIIYFEDFPYIIRDNVSDFLDRPTSPTTSETQSLTATPKT